MFERVACLDPTEIYRVDAFTPGEIDMARTLIQAFPKHEIIARESENELYINDNGLTGRGCIAIDPKCFPSIDVGEEYTLDEIISSEDKVND
jgi:hypothetical protein